MQPKNIERISSLGRFYVYAIHGYTTEIMFTALWEFVVNVNWKFPGNTSVWSFPIYGLSCLLVEQLHDFMVEHKVPLLLRGVVYVLWTYTWEFSSGFVLKQFGACPWDYTPFHADFMGLITLEYAPLWYIASIFHEKLIMYYTRRIFIGPISDEAQKKTFSQKQKKQTNGTKSANNIHKHE